MRYSVTGTTVQQVRASGGLNIKEAKATKIIFADLTEAQVTKLRDMGCKATKVGKVTTTVAPPVPITAVPTYSPEQLTWAVGLEDLRSITDPPLYGEGFNIAVVDTGIRETHEKVKGRVVYSKNFTSAPMRDGFDHGCTSPDSHVITDLFGQTRIEELYRKAQRLYTTFHCSNSDEFIPVPEDRPLYTLGFNEKQSEATRVRILHKIRIKGKVLRVHTRTGSVLLTPWHPCLIYNRSAKYVYKRADELRPSNHGSSLAHQLARANLPVGMNSQFQEIEIKYNLPSSGSQQEIARVDENVGYLLGLVLTDGHLDKKSRTSAGIAAESEQEAEKISEIIKNTFGYAPKYYLEGTCWNVHLHAKEWSLFKKLGVPLGRKSHAISVPPVIWRSPASVQLAFLAGVIDGDGSFDKGRETLRVVSVSEKFIDDLTYLLCSMGAKAYKEVYEYHRIVEITKGKPVQVEPYPVVTLNGASLMILLEKVKPYLRLRLPPASYRKQRKESTFVRNVNSIEEEEFDGYFYDLTTDTGNYLAGEGDLYVIHNTGVASIIVTVAPLCNILNIKVLDDKGEGTEEEVIMGVDHLLTMYDEDSEYAPVIINLSLGAPDDGNPDNPLRVACRAAIEREIWPIAAAGNEGPAPGTIMSPACERYVGAVGSCKYDPFIVSDWSSRGPTEEGLPKPDVVMFGEDIVVASSDSDTATIAKSGTSFSTPFTSAMGLLYHEGVYRSVELTQPVGEIPLEKPYYVPIEDSIDYWLPRICVKPRGVAAGRDYDYGYGLPFGPLVSQAVAPRPAVDISTILPAIMLVGMMGIMVRSIK